MAPSRRAFTAAVAAFGLADPVGALTDTEVVVADGDRGGPSDEGDGNRNGFTAPRVDVAVRQRSGEVHWEKPGKRPLEQFTFGGGEEPPRTTAKPWIRRLEGAPKRVLQQVPFLEGAPPAVREANDPPVGRSYDPDLAPQRTAVRTPFPQGREIDGRDGVVIPEVDGELDIEYRDRQRADTGVGGGTDDEMVADTTRFTDPEGNRYRFEVRRTVQPPWPSYETGGGVFTTAWFHGPTLTGTPLQPRQFAYGASWGVGDLYVNGELRPANRNRAFHYMTTQTVRKAENYELAFTPELPLEEPYLGQRTHTHFILPPVQATDDGPQVRPIDQPFNDQPFVHVMFDEADITRITVRP